MTDFLALEVSDNRWSDIVSKAREYDFHHTQSYHLLEEENKPILLVANFSDGFIALPIIIRPIDDSDYFDCTSVYGYCGPITSYGKEVDLANKAKEFKDFLLSYFREQKIVSAFSRLHPIIQNDHILDNLGDIRLLNKTVAVDLRITPEEQRKQYRKSNKSELNQLRRKGYEVVEAASDNEIDTFIEIYYETMKKVNAVDYYYFSKDYFYNFLNSKSFQNKLLLAKKEGEIVAGAIFTVANNIMQYHLAGTREAFMRETPMKLVLDEARLLGNSLGLDFLHLGGGVGGSDDDSLFRFKSGFSDLTFTYRVWQLIVDSKKYEELVIKKQVNATENANFFPLYRAIKTNK